MRDLHKTLRVGDRDYDYFALSEAPGMQAASLSRLPYSLRLLMEGVLRQVAQDKLAQESLLPFTQWQPGAAPAPLMPFFPGRVLLQDFTGVPVLNDLAGMRAALARLGHDPRRLNPIVPVDLVIDHSVQVDFSGTNDAFRRNLDLEFERNRERYEFLRWAEGAFDRLRVIPPGAGIVHQVNLERLAGLVLTEDTRDGPLVYAETLVGTDSHTTMINGLGVAGWGVGGVEAIAAMLGEPIEMPLPEVVGFELKGELREGTTPTDLALTVVQMLRRRGVVERIVEFYGPALRKLGLPERAMIANMAPESGATMLYFPVDEVSLDYLSLTGRPAERVELARAYFAAQGLLRQEGAPVPDFALRLSLDLGSVEPSVAGPKHPEERLALAEVPKTFEAALAAPKAAGGYGLSAEEMRKVVPVQVDGREGKLAHGSVAIAAITSCTNTSDPFVMMAAGLLARNAVRRGLRVPATVKTSLAPGSRVVMDYLRAAGLAEPLEQLGFELVAFGCTTCIGNSGPLAGTVAQAIHEGDLVAAAVLSGNRNFEGRVNPDTRANYLASPPLVVAYALAGTVDIDLSTEPLGVGSQGEPVFLRDVWPSSAEVNQVVQQFAGAGTFRQGLAAPAETPAQWQGLAQKQGVVYPWEEASTYLQEAPFLRDFSPRAEMAALRDVRGARVLAYLGDGVTTDHISPAGAIAVNSPAGRYLSGKGVAPKDFNSYGSRRGNHEVMVRGTLANIRLHNRLVPDTEGGMTMHFPDRNVTSIYEAAVRYQEEGVPLIILAGREYGTGSSRDWAAKGVGLLGVRAVIARSFERIHRSNLVGMGVVPLQFKDGEAAESLGLSGEERYLIEGLNNEIRAGQELTVRALSADGSEKRFAVDLRVETPGEIETLRRGGLMPMALSRWLAAEPDGSAGEMDEQMRRSR